MRAPINVKLSLKMGFTDGALKVTPEQALTLLYIDSMHASMHTLNGSAFLKLTVRLHNIAMRTDLGNEVDCKMQ